VFEDRMLRRIVGTKREVTGGWKRLHNEADKVEENEVGTVCSTNCREKKCM
jgi:hypothetical protein